MEELEKVNISRLHFKNILKIMQELHKEKLENKNNITWFWASEVFKKAEICQDEFDGVLMFFAYIGIIYSFTVPGDKLFNDDKVILLKDITKDDLNPVPDVKILDEIFADLHKQAAK
jgi:hypothetical protein